MLRLSTAFTQVAALAASALIGVACMQAIATPMQQARLEALPHVTLPGVTVVAKRAPASAVLAIRPVARKSV